MTKEKLTTLTLGRLKVSSITDPAPAVFNNMPGLLAIGTPGNRDQQGSRRPITTHGAAVKQKGMTPTAAVVAESFSWGNIDTGAVSRNAELAKVADHN